MRSERCMLLKSKNSRESRRKRKGHTHSWGGKREKRNNIQEIKILNNTKGQKRINNREDKYKDKLKLNYINNHIQQK